MFTLDYKETTVNPLSDKVVSGPFVCLKIFVEVCDGDEMRSVSYVLMCMCVCVSLGCLCPSGLYRLQWHNAWAGLHTLVRAHAHTHTTAPLYNQHHLLLLMHSHLD